MGKDRKLGRHGSYICPCCSQVNHFGLLIKQARTLRAYKFRLSQIFKADIIHYVRDARREGCCIFLS